MLFHLQDCKSLKSVHAIIQKDIDDIEDADCDHQENDGWDFSGTLVTLVRLLELSALRRAGSCHRCFLQMAF